MCVLAGMLALSVCTPALPEDAKIEINRALNSPTLTIKYTGAHVTLVELRVNGESMGTRSVSASNNAGETTFTLDLKSLKDGDNPVEVRLLDKDGKLVGSEKTIISTDSGVQGPVFLESPKIGATVQGAVQLSVGFGRNLKNAYVSFFIDNQFKSMSNYPPYTFMWDTAKETNGWHELEAWVVDDTSTTFKTRKVRVFVNNPGGRTYRNAPPKQDQKGDTKPDVKPATKPAAKPVDVTPSANPLEATIQGEAVAAKVALHQSTPVDGAIKAVMPAITGILIANPLWAKTEGTPSSYKPASPLSSVEAGAKSMIPTGTRLAPKPQAPKVQTPKVDVQAATQSLKTATDATIVKPANTTATLPKPQPANPKPKPEVAKQTPTVSTLKAATEAPRMVSIGAGTKLTGVKKYNIFWGSERVNFDVDPTTVEGVPVTPFRHLLEKAGGTVEWLNDSKAVQANADGRDIFLTVGDKIGRIDKLDVTLDIAPFLTSGRMIVPLSFMRQALSVNIEYDQKTGHVLITKDKK